MSNLRATEHPALFHFCMHDLADGVYGTRRRLTCCTVQYSSSYLENISLFAFPPTTGIVAHLPSSPLSHAQNNMSKIIVSVIMPSKGNKVILQQFIDEPTPFQGEKTIEEFYDTTLVPN